MVSGSAGRVYEGLHVVEYPGRAGCVGYARVNRSGGWDFHHDIRVVSMASFADLKELLAWAARSQMGPSRPCAEAEHWPVLTMPVPYRMPPAPDAADDEWYEFRRSQRQWLEDHWRWE